MKHSEDFHSLIDLTLAWFCLPCDGALGFTGRGEVYDVLYPREQRTDPDTVEEPCGTRKGSAVVVLRAVWWAQ